MARLLALLSLALTSREGRCLELTPEAYRVEGLEALGCQGEGPLVRSIP